jgi:tetratricopeptide (TPR) repeat protein
MSRRLQQAFWLLALVVAGCNSDSRQLLDQAEARWREGNYADAIRLNTLLYDRDPDGRYAAVALLNLGNIYYLNLRELNNAIQTYQKLVQELPDRPETLKAREKLAQIYGNEIGDLTQAVLEYENILASEGVEDRSEIRFQLANTLFKLNDFDRALRELRIVQQSQRTGHLSDLVQLKIGSIYQIRKRYEDALEPFLDVTRSPCPECRNRANLLLMETYEAMYDFDKAIEAVRRLDPTDDNRDRIERELLRLQEKRRRVESAALAPWSRRDPH